MSAGRQAGRGGIRPPRRRPRNQDVPEVPTVRAEEEPTDAASDERETEAEEAIRKMVEAAYT
jgi:hypothetical protein